VNASKTGFKKVFKKVLFSVIPLGQEIQRMGECEVDGACGPKENHQNCPQDCPSGSADGYCDGVNDDWCDPDCLVSQDPDCSAPICNKDKNCEPEVGENHENCPTDCASGIEDYYCDGFSDGKCDPDCTEKEDPDCVSKASFGLVAIIVLLGIGLVIALAIILYERETHEPSGYVPPPKPKKRKTKKGANKRF
jgi:hypothetical protein